MKIIVLGTTGMLGSMVHGYLQRNSRLQVIGSTRENFDAEAFATGHPVKLDLSADYIINCIGVIKPFCKDSDPRGCERAIKVNALFPHKLGQSARNQRTRVIQIATDCVYSGFKGFYKESDPHDALDVYGKTKSLGEVFDGSVLNLRCSIIGPEIKNRVSLLEWFLGNKDGSELNGFSHHTWNGITTLQFAELCEKIIENPGSYEDLIKISHIHHYIPNSTVNKFELLTLMSKIFEKNFKIKQVDNIGPPVNRALSTSFSALKWASPQQEMEKALFQLKKYMTSAKSV
ncbi:MAG TPA: SDR family oxidoreductase [Bdellovibrionota bacterium]|nr:SDR family oxidoreductase [Bdellovibrionota bacterium]